MSTAIEEHGSSTPHLRLVVDGQPIDEDSSLLAFTAPVAPETASALCQQILRLSEQYVRDMARLDELLADRDHDLKKARERASILGARAQRAEHLSNRLHIGLLIGRASLAAERQRARILREAATLPWYAIRRRRELVARADGLPRSTV